MPTYAIQFRSALKDRLFVGLLIAAVLALMLDVGLLAWRLPSIGASQPVLALHYNVFFGVDQVGDWRMAFFMPTLGAFFVIANFLVAVRLHAHERFVSRVMLGTAFAANVVLAIAALFVILANL